MSREIKFRIWDSKNKEWLGASDKNSLPFYGFHLVGEVMSVQCPPQWALDNGNIIEQYTGLKDKNGKEIYEGDIVKGDMGVFEVKWYDLVAQFMFRPNMSMKYHPPFTSTQLEVMEVIGNIHENPELLEGEG